MAGGDVSGLRVALCWRGGLDVLGRAVVVSVAVEAVVVRASLPFRRVW